MIIDRTIEEVNEALKIREEYIKTFQTPTIADIAILERGFVTLNTLNRIEEKQEELKQLLNENGYYNINIQNKNWTKNDIFGEVDFERILSNIDVLKSAFFIYSDTPETPEARYHFENFNSIEKILVDIENMLDDMLENFRECDTFECGED